jgi:hypothetical protein
MQVFENVNLILIIGGTNNFLWLYLYKLYKTESQFLNAFISDSDVAWGTSPSKCG